jgi:60 kDa SS-A/Ro ribonucleoprotein
MERYDAILGKNQFSWIEHHRVIRRLGSGGSKLVCIDLQPYATTQAPDCPDILNVGGFSDSVFTLVAALLGDGTGRFVAVVEAITL